MIFVTFTKDLFKEYYFDYVMPPGFEDYDSGDSTWHFRLANYRDAEAILNDQNCLRFPNMFLGTTSWISFSKT